MAIKISMPKLSDTMKEGRLIKWHKSEGDEVKPGDLLAEVETDKANMDLESFDKGTLLKRLAAENDKVPCGTIIALIGDKKENIDAMLKEIKSAAAPVAPAPVLRSLGEGGSPRPSPATLPKDKPSPALQKEDLHVPLSPSNDGIRVSPMAAKLAAEHGIPLDAVRGTGPGGRIIKQDIDSLVAQGFPGRLPDRSGRSASSPAVVFENRLTDSVTPLEGIRKVIAERMTQAKQTIPHFYLQDSICMDRIVRLRSERDVKLSLNDFVMMGVCRALAMHPNVNATFDGIGVHTHASVDLAFAVALDNGLITPIVRGCEKLGLAEIHAACDELAGRARKLKLKPDEYLGGSFTVSNLGKFGLDNFLPVINPPQVAILAVAAAKQEPCVDGDGHLYAGWKMGVTLACDHRALDGADGAKFLQDLKRVLEGPEAWAK